MEPKTHTEQLEHDEEREEFSDTPQGRKALERWARLQDENPGC